MQKATHASVAQSNTVKQSNHCNRGNMECTYKLFLIQISVQMHAGGFPTGTAPRNGQNIANGLLLCRCTGQKWTRLFNKNSRAAPPDSYVRPSD